VSTVGDNKYHIEGDGRVRANGNDIREDKSFILGFTARDSTSRRIDPRASDQAHYDIHE
jgi:hypothetical protein